MNKYYQLLKRISVIIFLAIGMQSKILAQENVILPDKSGDYMRGIYHVGLWVEDLDEMLSFLEVTTDFKILSRYKRQAGGERLFLEDPRGQRLELLSEPGNVKPHTALPIHPRGRIAGIAHISIEVDDVINVKEQLTAMGYEIMAQVPTDFSAGYVSSEVKEHRILFIKGPSSVSFEFFEIKD